ncbi:UAP56-interacting factor isoform X2 [Latimeria chalumnae]|uniref:UAP56-interacting factor isoform X2 n=1 Tax=Latimeria chalumnae TaxID=7897 RepID=UPI0003C15AE3|nr:PREDICTED: UAP56-interacting factor isoform X2 [Latimeria chalumnae]|eukprot:XP_005997409.1 PREDICTED: UAP56-interacting factor isoform X2 [Latimeria chalumnae]
MSGFGSGAAGPGPANPGGSGAAGLDKIDMSLDDIIKLNRKEQRQLKMALPARGRSWPSKNKRIQQSRAQPLWRRGIWRGTQQGKGAGPGVHRLGPRGKKTTAVGKRPSQGVITGLAARRAGALRKGISPLNRPVLNAKNVARTRPALQRRATPRQYELQRRQLAPLRRPAQLRRRNFGPAGASRPGAQVRNPVPQQKEARQATFLFRRGLKVQTQVHVGRGPSRTPNPQRTRPWRTSTTNGGILTVSIDNPGALQHQPVSPRPRITRPAMPPFILKKESAEEKKIPKGVPLQFDINSVGKQTGMTLNERFRILKDQRTTLVSPQSKGSRFVTVG